MDVVLGPIMDDDELNETLAMIARCDRHQWPYYYSADAVASRPRLIPQIDTAPPADIDFSDVA